MKKIFLCTILVLIVCLTGCGSIKDKDIRESFIKNTTNLKSYYMEGTLKITNNDDSYEYDVKTSYKKDDNYKVSLVNKANKYEQIILKNEDGVYVITPSLNKSFKFQSDWPKNNSQSYLIDSVANDLEKDDNYTFTQKNNDYIFTIKTNYPNNPKYTKQNIVLDKDKKLKKVEVQDEDDITYVEYEVKKIEENKKFNDTEFSLNDITKDFDIKDTTDEETKNAKSKSTQTNNQNDNMNNSQNQGEQTNEANQDQNSTSTEDSNYYRNNTDNSNADSNANNSNLNGSENEETNKSNEASKAIDNVFPLYLPANTSLSDKEVISTNNGQRIIMTFSGDNPFIFVQETVKPSSSLEVIPTYGEPFMLVDTVGSLTDTSYTWTSNGVEYYIVSDQMDKKELLEVAKSVNVMSVINEK